MEGAKFSPPTPESTTLRSNMLARIKLTTSLPRMKDGRRPAMPRQADGLEVHGIVLSTGPTHMTNSGDGRNADMEVDPETEDEQVTGSSNTMGTEKHSVPTPAFQGRMGSRNATGYRNMRYAEIHELLVADRKGQTKGTNTTQPKRPIDSGGSEGPYQQRPPVRHPFSTPVASSDRPQRLALPRTISPTSPSRPPHQAHSPTQVSPTPTSSDARTALPTLDQLRDRLQVRARSFSSDEATMRASQRDGAGEERQAPFVPSRRESYSMSFAPGPSSLDDATENAHARSDDRSAARLVVLRKLNARLGDDISGLDEEGPSGGEGLVPSRTQRKRKRRVHRRRKSRPLGADETTDDEYSQPESTTGTASSLNHGPRRVYAPSLQHMVGEDNLTGKETGGQRHNIESDSFHALPNADGGDKDPPSPFTGLPSYLGRGSPPQGEGGEDADGEYVDSDAGPMPRPAAKDEGPRRPPENTPPLAENEEKKFLPYLRLSSIMSRLRQPEQHDHATSPVDDGDITGGEATDDGELVRPQNAEDKAPYGPAKDSRPFQARRSTPAGDESDGGSQPPSKTRNRRRGASNRPAAPAIGGTMTASNIISQLVQHGCQDITQELNLSSCTKHPISTGGFGDIYRGKLKDGSLVAIKCMRVFFGSPGGQKHMKHAAREIHTWSKCEHRHVLKLLGMVKFRGQIGMVSPWVTRGSLNNYLAENPDMNRPQLCTQVADGLAYLHLCGVVHGDLKGANVLLSDDGDPLLTDFGNAILQERTLQFTYTTAKTSLSPRWAAPELIRGEESFSFEADMFALGMTILEIITGSVPYSRLNDFGVMYAIAEGRLPERPEDSIPTKSKHGDLLWSILTRCWEREAKSRPSASVVRDQMMAIQPEGLLAVTG